jgi:hypothetical protein
MKYLKSFNESLDRNELRDFCEMYLAYLLDKSNFNLEVFSSTKDISIIELRDNPEGTTFSGDKIFTWSSVKDHIIPFLKMLDKSYDIETIRVFQYGKDRESTGLVSHSVRSMERLSDDTKMKWVTISVSNKKSFIQKVKSFFVSEAYNKPRAGGKKRWSVKYKKTINCSNPKGFSQKQYCKRKRKGGAYKNESVESVMGGLIEKVGKVVMGVNDLCEQHLVYLQDEGFIYDVDLNPDLGQDNSDLYDSGDIIFKLGKNDEEFSWNEIKDRFIPFLIMLKKEFDVLEEVQFSINHVNVYLISDEWFDIDELCDDNFEMDYEIKEIIININI